MDLPLGYRNFASSRTQRENMVCKLHKSIYGLKQALRQWLSKFSNAFNAHGFTQSKSNYSLFTKGSGNSFIALLVNVDDILITRCNQLEITSFKSFLHSQFKLKDLGNLKYFLGLEIARSKKGIFLSQKKYALQLLVDSGFLACKPAMLRMDPKLKLSSLDGDLVPDTSMYRSLIGRLLYLLYLGLISPMLSTSYANLCLGPGSLIWMQLITFCSTSRRVLVKEFRSRPILPFNCMHLLMRTGALVLIRGSLWFLHIPW